MHQKVLKVSCGGRVLHLPRSSGSKARPVVPYYRVPTNGLLWVSVTALRLARRILPQPARTGTRSVRRGVGGGGEGCRFASRRHWRPQEVAPSGVGSPHSTQRVFGGSAL